MSRIGLFFVLVVSSVMLFSCSEYQSLLKHGTQEEKYAKAMEYYEAEEYLKASTLFEELIGVYRGSDKAEKLTLYYANALFGLEDYLMAGHYYEQYVKTYPAGEYLEECQFQNAYCKYKMSPKPRLDQTSTYEAINEFQLFINMFPNSARVTEASRLLDEMRDKLVYKSYLNAKLYFDLGSYMGNNYKSAVIAAQNSLKEFPDTRYREDLSFLILESKYYQAVKSVESKKEDRARETIDEYYSFINEFPNSEYARKAESIYTDSNSMLQKK